MSLCIFTKICIYTVFRLQVVLQKKADRKIESKYLLLRQQGSVKLWLELV